MLGLALTEVLQSLAEIPASERTEKQQALFEELALLYVASKTPAREISDAAQITLHAELRSQIKLKDLVPFSVTRPKVTRPKPSRAGMCPFCGQPRPAST
jgi:hypothetical protein